MTESFTPTITEKAEIVLIQAIRWTNRSSVEVDVAIGEFMKHPNQVKSSDAATAIILRDKTRVAPRVDSIATVVFEDPLRLDVFVTELDSLRVMSTDEDVFSSASAQLPGMSVSRNSKYLRTFVEECINSYRAENLSHYVLSSYSEPILSVLSFSEPLISFAEVPALYQ